MDGGNDSDFYVVFLENHRDEWRLSPVCGIRVSKAAIQKAEGPFWVVQRRLSDHYNLVVTSDRL